MKYVETQLESFYTEKVAPLIQAEIVTLEEKFKPIVLAELAEFEQKIMDLVGEKVRSELQRMADGEAAPAPAAPTGESKD